MENQKTFQAIRLNVLSEIIRNGAKQVNSGQLKTLLNWFKNVDRNSRAALEIVNFMKGYLEQVYTARTEDPQEADRRDMEYQDSMAEIKP